MNKIVFIGDIHGHDSWKPIVSKHKDADHFVFVGDYFDAWSVTPAVQIHNFKEIIEFKESNPEQVTLLIGNHDFHYMPSCRGQYGGYSAWFAAEIWDVLRTNIHNLQVAWQYNNVLVTHAGVSSTWYERNVEDKGHMFEIADKVNACWADRPDLFNHSGLNIYGNSPHDGPFWIRPQALRQDPIDPEIVQIVGHTQREEISNDDNVFVIDTLPREFLILEEGEFIIERVYSK